MGLCGSHQIKNSGGIFMSNISVVYGYGFETEYDFQKFSNFLKNHRATFCRSEKENKLYEEFEQLSSDCNIEKFFFRKI